MPGARPCKASDPPMPSFGVGPARFHCSVFAGRLPSSASRAKPSNDAEVPKARRCPLRTPPMNGSGARPGNANGSLIPTPLLKPSLATTRKRHCAPPDKKRGLAMNEKLPSFTRNVRQVTPSSLLNCTAKRSGSASASVALMVTSKDDPFARARAAFRDDHAVLHDLRRGHASGLGDELIDRARRFIRVVDFLHDQRGLLQHRAAAIELADEIAVRRLGCGIIE